MARGNARAVVGRATKKPSKPVAAKARAPATLRAKTLRAPMSKAAPFSRAEVDILGRMGQLEADDPRYRVLEAALAFKSSWVILGEHLASVAQSGLFRGWGYASFERYCTDEVHVTVATARKLVKGYDWLREDAPEYVQAVDRAGHRREPPDLATIAVMADARKELAEERVPEDAYLSLKQAALDGSLSATALRRTLKDSVPAHLRPRPLDDRVRHLRKALTACVKVIDGLREWDAAPAAPGGDDVDDGSDAGPGSSDDLIVQAEALRDAIADKLPRRAPESAQG